MSESPTPHPANPQKGRIGLNRILHALGYSMEGLRAGWHETAFRQEVVAACVLLPLSLWLGRSWVETSLAPRLYRRSTFGAAGHDRRAAQHRH